MLKIENNKNKILKKAEIKLLSHSSILLIEEKKTSSLFHIFSKIFKNVYYASNNLQAKELFKHNQYEIDIVLNDLDISNLCENEILTYIRINLANNTIPVIVLTNAHNMDRLLSLIKLQVNDYICKPFDMNKLLKILAKHIVTRYEHNLLVKKFKIYENIIEETNLISQTNTKGIITFANDKFCEISGYSKKELLGKNHNIIRHEDMPESAFKDLWNTIQSGKTWVGKIKNRKKDGSHYWVKAYVNPIYDDKGIITSYVATRHLITQEIDFQKDLKDHIKGIKVKQNNDAKILKNVLQHKISEKFETHIIELKDEAQILEYENGNLLEKNVIAHSKINNLENLAKITTEGNLEDKNKSLEKDKEINTLKIKIKNLEKDKKKLEGTNKKHIKRINQLEDVFKHT